MVKVIPINIRVIKPKKFNREFGKRTRAGAFRFTKKTKVGKIVIRSSLRGKARRRIIGHEVGHIVTEQQMIAEKVPRKERKVLIDFSNQSLARARLKHAKPREKIDEALANFYQAKRAREVSNTKLEKIIPITNRLLNRSIKNVRPKLRFIKENG